MLTIYMKGNLTYSDVQIVEKSSCITNISDSDPDSPYDQLPCKMFAISSDSLRLGTWPR